MIKKILVIRYRFIGDTVLTIPFLRNLRRAYPQAQIDMLVGPVSGDVLLDCPYIDNLIYFDTTKKHRYENTGEQKRTFFSYVKLLRQSRYDKAYVLKRSFSSAALAFLAGIKDRIGFDTEGRGFLLTKKILYVKNKHEVECFLDILKADDIPVRDNHLENWISDKSEEKIQEILKNYDLSEKQKVLVHATSGNINKQWPVENFAKIIEFLSNEKNILVFFTGTAGDSEIYDRILNLIHLELKNKPVNLCGELSIQDSTALINKMNFVVGSDSGTLHIAASLNIPVIGIYGPMNPKKWRAWGEIHKPVSLDLPCIPCELRKKCDKDYACIKNITPEMVIKEIESFI
ncbi:MAG: lipopolysaccharide heptosyltransferase II [bacterium]